MDKFDFDTFIKAGKDSKNNFGNLKQQRVKQLKSYSWDQKGNKNIIYAKENGNISHVNFSDNDIYGD